MKMYKKDPRKPTESHKTASWANVEDTKELSNAAKPSVYSVVNAKEYVDENEK